MPPMLLRRNNAFKLLIEPHFLSRLCNFCTRVSTIVNNTLDATNNSVCDNNNGTGSANYFSRLHLSPLFSCGRPHIGGFDIKLVDADTWQVSSGLVLAWKGKPCLVENVDEVVNDRPCDEGEPDFDQIEDMRIQGNLFYKLDRDSKEYEEYNFNFRRKKSSKNKNEPKERKMKKNSSQNVGLASENFSKSNKKHEEQRKKEGSDKTLASRDEELNVFMKSKHASPFYEMGSSFVENKKLRTPTFNQLTALYHEPFCLDIYISKNSVRACVVHRVTSKVVAVSHSISKDMKFDLASTKNSSTCAAVGGVLAQRALADDIHNVVYTPRRGEKLEGKLQIVLQAIIDNGINVKVKIKQSKAKKVGYPLAARKLSGNWMAAESSRSKCH